MYQGITISSKERNEENMNLKQGPKRVMRAIKGLRMEVKENLSSAVIVTYVEGRKAHADIFL